MTDASSVLVYGAYGLTGRFVVTEMVRRGLTPVLGGRSAARLAALADLHPDLHVRLADAADPESLDRALVGVDAVINCAGPFLDTAVPVVEAALRAQVPYLDIAAEQPSTTSLFSDFDARAREAGVTVLPAMGFFGALADLLATLAMGDWADADAIEIATALEGWRPTAGTVLTGTRNVEPIVSCEPAGRHPTIPRGSPTGTSHPPSDGWSWCRYRSARPCCCRSTWRFPTSGPASIAGRCTISPTRTSPGARPVRTGRRQARSSLSTSSSPVARGLVGPACAATTSTASPPP